MAILLRATGGRPWMACPPPDLDAPAARPGLFSASRPARSPTTIVSCIRAGVENAAALAASRGDPAEARRHFEAALAVDESLDLGGHPHAETLRKNIAGLPAEDAGVGE